MNKISTWIKLYILTNWNRPIFLSFITHFSKAPQCLHPHVNTLFTAVHSCITLTGIWLLLFLQIITTLGIQRGYISIITASGEYYHGDCTRFTGKILRSVPSPGVFTSTKVKPGDPGKSIYDHSNVLAKMGFVLLRSYKDKVHLYRSARTWWELIHWNQRGGFQWRALWHERAKLCSGPFPLRCSTVPLWESHCPWGQHGVLPFPLPATLCCGPPRCIAGSLVTLLRCLWTFLYFWTEAGCWY